MFMSKNRVHDFLECTDNVCPKCFASGDLPPEISIRPAPHDLLLCKIQDCPICTKPIEAPMSIRVSNTDSYAKNGGNK